MSWNEARLYEEAAGLVSDEGENPEYDRALCELIMRLTGEDRDVVMEKLKCQSK